MNKAVRGAGAADFAGFRHPTRKTAVVVQMRSQIVHSLYSNNTPNMKAAMLRITCKCNVDSLDPRAQIAIWDYLQRKVRPRINLCIPIMRNSLITYIVEIKLLRFSLPCFQLCNDYMPCEFRTGYSPSGSTSKIAISNFD
jgi:hypothetical protein